MGQIHFRNTHDLERKVRDMRSEGIGTVHIISDFHRTLTKCFVNGTRLDAAIVMIRDHLHPNYPVKADALIDTYQDIENDETLDYAYRYRKLEEWWNLHANLIIESGMHRDVIDAIVQENPDIFRDGTEALFNRIAHERIPMIIFSAGIGNVIEGFLRREGWLSEHTHILSNTFEFDKSGKAVGFGGEAIHMLNKTVAKIPREYKEIIASRPNVLLLGDSLSDAGMTNTLHARSTIKIGFLNEDIDAKLDAYLKAFDVVITDDGSLDYANELLDTISNPKHDQ